MVVQFEECCSPHDDNSDRDAPVDLFVQLLLVIGNFIRLGCRKAWVMRWYRDDWIWMAVLHKYSQVSIAVSTERFFTGTDTYSQALEIWTVGLENGD